MAKVRRALKRVKSTKLATVFARVHARRGLLVLVQSAGVLGLTKTDSGRLFGVTRQAIGNWYKRGVPMSRVADVDRIAAVAGALYARFAPERIPHIARAPLPGLNGLTILEAIRISGTPSVLDMLERAFTYTPEK